MFDAIKRIIRRLWRRREFDRANEVAKKLGRAYHHLPWFGGISVDRSLYSKRFYVRVRCVGPHPLLHRFIVNDGVRVVFERVDSVIA